MMADRAKKKRVLNEYILFVLGFLVEIDCSFFKFVG